MRRFRLILANIAACASFTKASTTEGVAKEEQQLGSGWRRGQQRVGVPAKAVKPHMHRPRVWLLAMGPYSFAFGDFVLYYTGLGKHTMAIRDPLLNIQRTKKRSARVLRNSTDINFEF